MFGARFTKAPETGRAISTKTNAYVTPQREKEDD
jgi:hypothetical protein